MLLGCQQDGAKQGSAAEEWVRLRRLGGAHSANPFLPLLFSQKSALKNSVLRRLPQRSSPRRRVPRASRAVTSVRERSAEQRGSKGRKKKQLLSREFDLLQGRRAFINKVPGSHALSSRRSSVTSPVSALRHMRTHSWTHTDIQTHSWTHSSGCTHTDTHSDRQTHGHKHSWIYIHSHEHRCTHS